MIYVDNYYPSHRRKRNQMGREFVFVVHGVTSFLDGRSPFAWLYYVALERHDSQLESGFACMRSVHAAFLISPTLKVGEKIFTLGCFGFYLVWT